MVSEVLTFGGLIQLSSVEDFKQGAGVLVLLFVLVVSERAWYGFCIM